MIGEGLERAIRIWKAKMAISREQRAWGVHDPIISVRNQLHGSRFSTAERLRIEMAAVAFGWAERDSGVQVGIWICGLGPAPKKINPITASEIKGGVDNEAFWRLNHLDLSKIAEIGF